MTAMLSYWALSDVFEEQGVVKQPFYGGYGLMAAGNVPKPARDPLTVAALNSRVVTSSVARCAERASTDV